MAEETVWRGTSSQVKNAERVTFSAACAFASFFFSSLFSGAMNQRETLVRTFCRQPSCRSSSRFRVSSRRKTKLYELTTERLKITEGVFNKVTDTLELYRVKDLETRQPFWERAFGVENVQINTTDVSTPFVLIEAVPKKIGLGDKIRNAVENVRMQKRVGNWTSSDCRRSGASL